MTIGSNNPEDSINEFKEGVKAQTEQVYVLKLYVSGMTPRSLKAIENIKKIVDETLKGHYELEIIDIYQHPELARSDQIIAAPTLIKKLPLPIRKIIGDMSDKERVIVGLNLVPKKYKFC